MREAEAAGQARCWLEPQLPEIALTWGFPYTDRLLEALATTIYISSRVLNRASIPSKLSLADMHLSAHIFQHPTYQSILGGRDFGAGSGDSTCSTMAVGTKRHKSKRLSGKK